MRAAILRPMTETLTGCSGTLGQSAVHAILYCTVFDRAFAGERSVTTRIPYVGNGSLSCEIQTPSQLQLLRATTSHHSPGS